MEMSSLRISPLNPQYLINTPGENSLILMINKIKNYGDENTINLATKIINTIQYLVVENRISNYILKHLAADLNECNCEGLNPDLFVASVEQYARNHLGWFCSFYINPNSYSPGKIFRSTEINNLLKYLHNKKSQDGEDISREKYTELDLAIATALQNPNFENYKSVYMAANLPPREIELILSKENPDNILFYLLNKYNDNERLAFSMKLARLIIRYNLTNSPIALKLFRSAMNRRDIDEVMDYLIKNGFNINTYWREMTLLSSVCGESYDPYLCRIFIDAGADPNLNDENCLTTPLHRAAFYTYPGLVDFLIHSGAQLNTKDSDGNTALHLAISSHNYRHTRYPRETTEAELKTVCALLALGANPNLQNNDKNTPLHLATKRGSELLCKALILGKASLDIVDRNGKTPLEIEALSDRIGPKERAGSRVVDVLNTSNGIMPHYESVRKTVYLPSLVKRWQLTPEQAQEWIEARGTLNPECVLPKHKPTFNSHITHALIKKLAEYSKYGHEDENDDEKFKKKYPFRHSRNGSNVSQDSTSLINDSANFKYTPSSIESCTLAMSC